MYYMIGATAPVLCAISSVGCTGPSAIHVGGLHPPCNCWVMHASAWRAESCGMSAWQPAYPKGLQARAASKGTCCYNSLVSPSGMMLGMTHAAVSIDSTTFAVAPLVTLAYAV